MASISIFRGHHGGEDMFSGTGLTFAFTQVIQYEIGCNGDVAIGDRAW